ncbi:hypothetical protein [Actinoplanes sp. L3-i22]|uniref:hypothetical protein n=1 Tax=Actinoplanes sp. L3-i22 TaxID=2836373 RepID=UPI001C785C50|nr:hypothetical protein [Actinoplanes sp. L3-i22]BCY11338.1 hypothetical protein L3i22_064260 [Actinoplanes sp. L3-i22]
MVSVRIRLSAAALLLLGGVAACSGEGTPEGLPSNRPSVERTTDRTTQPTPTDDETTKTERPEPTRTRETTKETTNKPTTEPTKETTTEPTKETTTEPTKETTTKPAQPQEPVATATSTSAVAVVPVAEEDSGGAWGWLLLIGLFTGLVALLMLNRNRKVTTWDGTARGLAGETRTVLGVRLPPLLTMTDAGERGLAWPPVRDDLTALEARWAALLETTPDGERHAYASQVAGMLRDLVNAVDAENEAMAAGRNWQLLRPRLDAIIAALSAALEPAPTPDTVYATTPSSATGTDTATGYGTPPPSATGYGTRPPSATGYGTTPPPTTGYGAPPSSASGPAHGTTPDTGYPATPGPAQQPPRTTEYGEPIDDDPDDPYNPPRQGPPRPGYPS